MAVNLARYTNKVFKNIIKTKSKISYLIFFNKSLKECV